MLKNVKTRLADVQKKIQELLPPDAILVGHSLNFDLDALQVNNLSIWVNVLWQVICYEVLF